MVFNFFVSAFIFVVIILSTANTSVSWKSLSSCWRLFWNHVPFVFFSTMISLSLSDVFAILSCSSSFQVVIVKPTDSSDYVSCSTVVGGSYRWSSILSFLLANFREYIMCNVENYTWSFEMPWSYHILKCGSMCCFRCRTIAYETNVGFRCSLVIVPGWLLYTGEMIFRVISRRMRSTSFLLEFCRICFLPQVICLCREIVESLRLLEYLKLVEVLPLSCISLLFWLFYNLEWCSYWWYEVVLENNLSSKYFCIHHL